LLTTVLIQYACGRLRSPVYLAIAYDDIRTYQRSEFCSLAELKRAFVAVFPEFNEDPLRQKVRDSPELTQVIWSRRAMLTNEQIAQLGIRLRAAPGNE